VRLLRGRPVAEVALAAATLQPTETARVTVTIGEELDRVVSARVALGYVNTYAYRWAGRRDAALRGTGDTLATLGMEGTDHGSERVTEDWVDAGDQALPVASGVLEEGVQTVSLLVPSWAPGTTEDLVRWAVRLEVDRGGRRDVREETALRVLAPRPDPVPELAFDRIAGRSSEIDVRTEHPCYRPGETVRGVVAMTAAEPLPQADVAVRLSRGRTSHPLERTPADEVAFDMRPVVTLDDELSLTPGVTTELPFALDLPPTAGPSASAVHGTLTWYVLARVNYRGFNAHMPERVRRAFVVYDAP
jgi:hypothetical protein